MVQAPVPVDNVSVCVKVPFVTVIVGATITSERGVNVGDCTQIADTVSNIDGDTAASTASGINVVARRASGDKVVSFHAVKIYVAILLLWD